MNTAFKNESSDSGAATNVGVQLYDASAAKVSPSSAVDVSSFLTADATTTEAHIPFTARMVAVADTATAGTLVSHADYTISYQ